MPSNIPDLVLSVAETDLAPLARNVTSASAGMVSGIIGLLFTDYSIGYTFTSMANVLSAVGAVSANLVSWTPPRVPPLPRSPVGFGSPSGNSTADDPWHGLPSMVFGKSPVAWLYDQTDPTRIKTLGDVCEQLQTKIAGQGVLSFRYPMYVYDEINGKIRNQGVNTPLSPETIQTFLRVMKLSCEVLSNAATMFKAPLAPPKNGPVRA